jgi:signal transduction histidine kinase
MAAAEVGTRLALRRVVVGYRLASALWAAVLGLAALAGESAQRPVVIATLGLIAAWTLATVALALRAPDVLTSWGFVVADVAVSAWAIASSSFAGAAFYGGYPFSSVLVAVYGHGAAGAVLAAVPLATVATGRLQGSRPWLSALNDGALFWLVGAGVVTWGVEVLRRAERQRLAYEAELAREREERLRSAERAETAAHLHDSVLQTLALLQRRSDDPAEVVALARRQERELRDWLSGGAPASTPARMLRASLEEVAAEVERDHRLTVEVVVVGNAALDDRVAALVSAAREALVNAAKHAGVDRVAVYAEADAAVARVFVRDRGAGFDPEDVAGNGRGLRESIVGRLDRHGGTAAVRSAPGAGTEVTLTLPLGDVSAPR